MPLKLALVFVGGGLGSCLRFLIGVWTVHHVAASSRWPWGTFAVNVLGCCAIGAFAAWGAGRYFVADLPRAFFVVGLLGGFTTFSSFGFEAFTLLRNGYTILALTYAVGSLALGFGGVWVGYTLGR